MQGSRVAGAARNGTTGTTGTTNWAGNVRFAARAVHRPRSVPELQDRVAGSGRVRALGSGHSFSPVADTTGDLLVLDELPGEIEVDGDRVRVPAAARFAALNPVLHAAGRALANLGSLPHIAVAGACATGTHGSGDGLGALATAVTAVELVRADGRLATVRRGDPEFPGSVVALGAVGIVTALEMATVPTYRLAQWVREDVPLDVLPLGAARSVSAFTRTWERFDQVWLKGADADIGRPAPGPRHMTAGEDPGNCTPQLGEPGPWHERLPHFRSGFTPSSGAELQSEYLVPRAAAADALAAVAALRERITPLLLVSEVRSIAADDLWLSPAYGRDSVAIHFTWRLDPAGVRPVVAAVEAALDPFEPRPHWGKVFTTPATRLAALYPRLPDAVALFDKQDPTGKFRNAMLDRCLPT